MYYIKHYFSIGEYFLKFETNLMLVDCFSPTEIALLIDTSGTPGDDDKEDLLGKFKTFSKELLHGFSLAETAARVAVVTYSDGAKVDMDFGNGRSFQTVENNIDDIELSNTPNRNLEEALRFTSENVFSLKGGLRKVICRNKMKQTAALPLARAPTKNPRFLEFRL